MGRKRKLTANEIIETINNTAPKFVFYTDKISIRLKNLDSINIIDFQGENNPLMNLSVSTLIEDPNIEQNELDLQLESKVNYLEAINEYFKLKQKYEKKILSDKKAFLQLTTNNIRSQKET